MEKRQQKYEKLYGLDIQEYQNDFAFGWISFLLVLMSLLVMIFVGVWSKTLSILWGNILNIFFIIFLPAVVLIIFIRLFPSTNARLVYHVKEGHFSDILLQVGICILAGILNFWVLSIAFGQTLFEGSFDTKLFAVCNSTWEELLFCGGQIGIMRFAVGTEAKILGVGIRMLLFAVYHIVVYGNIAQAMIGMLFMGLIYGIALVIWKRVDISMLTHLGLNLIAS